MAKTKKNCTPKVTIYSFREFSKILNSYGFYETRVCNSTHMKFKHRETGQTLVVSGLGGKVRLPICQKIFKQANII